MSQEYRARLARVKERRKELDENLQVNTQEMVLMHPKFVDFFLKGLCLISVINLFLMLLQICRDGLANVEQLKRELEKAERPEPVETCCESHEESVWSFI